MKNPSKNRYQQLNHDERETIALYNILGYTYQEIADILGRNKSTISREISRNSTSIYNCIYRANRAQLVADYRKRYTHKKERLKNNFIRSYVHKKLEKYWSPEQIAGRLSLDHPDHKINYESIYLYIYNDRPDLIKYLRKQHKKRKKRGKKNKNRVSKIPNRISIDNRPMYINNRSEYGHWELDAIVSRQSKAALGVGVERKSKFTLINLLDSKTSSNFSISFNRRLSHYPKYMRKSFTYDNGTENVEHERMNKILNSKSFFCNPYHSWEKGTIENTNGLIRFYFPKKTDFSKVPKENIKYIERELNNRPRKCLNYKTPAEVFKKAVALKH